MARMLRVLKRLGGWTGRVGRAVAVVVVILIAGGAAAWLASGNTPTPGSENDEKKSDEKEKKAAEAKTKVRRTGADTIVVPAEAQASLGLKTAPAVVPTRKRKLPSFQGTLNYDNNLLARVQSPFSGPIVELKQISEPLTSALPNSTSAKFPRPLKVGDRVEKGDVLAVVWSADLGSKKSDYVDALSRLKTDEETLKAVEEAAKIGAIPERTLRDTAQMVKSDRVAVERAEATLRAWRIPEADITALRVEAEHLAAPDAKRSDPTRWARVEIKAPLAGTVLEKSVAMGQIVDPTVDLFRIGDMSALTVWVHVFEEDLPLLRGLELPIPWEVTVPAMPGSSYTGRLEYIGAALDPNQHTALVTGTVENPRGELRVGMRIAVAVKLDPAKGEIEVPSEAVCENGRESVVFVRPDPKDDKFVRRPVTVVRRSRDTIAIAERSDGLKPGEQVVTSGSLLLNDAFTDQPQPK
jgi:cobalt-zinc-cadmium efflux system membrane fusion protein